MHVYLRTERLVLRRFVPEDLPALEALDGDVEYAITRDEWQADRTVTW